MVLGLLVLLAITSIPTTIGTGLAVSESKKKIREAKLTQECHLQVFCEADERLHGGIVVLRDNKVYISTTRSASDGYPFTGFYITYPTSSKHLGLVSMISDNPPAMGWLYADRHTHELRYGNRSQSMPHVFGPWDFTEDEVGLTLKGDEAFVAVEEEEGMWAVYYDETGDFGDLPGGKTAVEVSLERKVAG